MKPRIALSDTGTECGQPAAPRNRRRRKHARPKDLLDAALAVFVEKGFAAMGKPLTTVRGIHFIH